MISDRLYGLAFEYKKKKLWRILNEMEMFAVRLSGGRIGYANVLGEAGEHFALSLYIGEEGFSSFRSIAKTDPSMMTPLQLQEHILQQQCLQCALEGKDQLSREEQEEAKKYARSHGIRIAGKNAYPQFVKYQPGCCPWHLQTNQEQDDLGEALQAALELARLLEEKEPKDLGLKCLDDETEEILMLERQGQAYMLGKAEIPKEKPKVFPAPKASNDIGVASLKKAKRMGVWECEIIRFPQPVQNEPEEAPYFPMTVLAVESSSGYMLQVTLVKNYEEDSEELLNSFMDALLQEKICPIKIKARDERTYLFVKALCDKLKITVSTGEDLPMLDDAEDDLMDRFGMSEDDDLDDFGNLLDTILQMDSEQPGTLSEGMSDFFQMVEGLGILPDDVQEKLGQLIAAKATARPREKKPKTPKKKKGPDQYYKISVSLGKGCYRHIQIPGGCTLWDLHAAILDAFGFMDDHAHAFFMDNVSWSGQDCYYMEGIEDYYRTTDEYALDEVDLYEGMKFKYVFDFGDEWTFQCKVLKASEGSLDGPMVTRSKGIAPEQYPQWDEDE